MSSIHDVEHAWQHTWWLQSLYLYACLAHVAAQLKADVNFIDSWNYLAVLSETGASLLKKQ